MTTPRIHADQGPQMATGALDFADLVAGFARSRPDAIAAQDLSRSITYAQWDRRANRIANALLAMGAAKGDRIAILAYNCLEWMELYLACARCGTIAVPINFRLTAGEVLQILDDSGARIVVAQDELHHLIEEARQASTLSTLVHFGTDTPRNGWVGLEAAIAAATDAAPPVAISPDDPWTLMYTSGTTGQPKGVIRDHRGMAMLALVTAVEMSIRPNDHALLVMPMCHANSLNFMCAFSYCGARVSIHSRSRFDPAEVLDSMRRNGCSFTSLVPTQYTMLLAHAEGRDLADGLDCVNKLLISSAPAHAQTKRRIMAMFPNAGLFELYGSSEAGWVTMLHPDEQFDHLGSVGRECVGSMPVRLLDEHGQEVPDGTPGELHSRTPHTFTGYWNQPEKTRAAFRDGYCTVGDMAVRDDDGFLRLVDRKKNMIISGGENVYPSEVENVVAACPGVQEVAVIGLPDPVWGETVHAVVVARAGADLSEYDVIAWCTDRIAGFKRPRSVSFMEEQRIPRTATGKLLHRVLREMLATPAAGGTTGQDLS